jgi:hypothetical protein
MGIMTNFLVTPNAYTGSFPRKSNGREISRLISAAVVNNGFCQMLLKNPKMAIDHGFKGETFSFEREEQDLILSIRASNLAEFANQLTDRSIESLKKNGNGHHKENKSCE